MCVLFVPVDLYASELCDAIQITIPESSFSGNFGAHLRFFSDEQAGDFRASIFILEHVEYMDVSPMMATMWAMRLAKEDPPTNMGLRQDRANFIITRDSAAFLLKHLNKVLDWQDIAQQKHAPVKKLIGCVGEPEARGSIAVNFEAWEDKDNKMMTKVPLSFYYAPAVL